MLADIDDQVSIQICKRFINCACVESRVISVLLLSDQDDGHANQSGLENPLDHSLRCEASITADLVQNTVELQVVDPVETADPKSIALHLGVESQIDQQIVVQKVDDHNKSSDARKNYGYYILILFLGLLFAVDHSFSANLLDEANCREDNKHSKCGKESKLEVLDQVYEP